MKVIKGLINVLTTLIIVVGVIFIGLYICGITPYVVLSGSMEPTIKTGSLCFINKHTKYEKIKEKDIIAFKMSNGTLVTHRIISIADDGFVTKGDNNDNQDGFSKKDKYVGKNIFWIPKVGYVVKAFQTTKGKLILGTCIVLLIAAGFLIGDDKKKVSKDKELTLEITNTDILKGKKLKK
ncbi:MAG: signal peptidase I [Bacilli bacterium]|nr:signal peptidase I [Bacilli bacterium]